MKGLKHLKPEVRLSITNPESDSHSEYGRGIAQLCLGVRETGSLNAAAKRLGMAYSKAWRIIKETEAALDVQLLNRNGAHGSTLTEEGDALLDSYLKLAEDMSGEAERRYQELLAQEAETEEAGADEAEVEVDGVTYALHEVDDEDANDEH